VKRRLAELIIKAELIINKIKLRKNGTSLFNFETICNNALALQRNYPEDYLAAGEETQFLLGWSLLVFSPLLVLSNS
jgi:hypothetical protein